MEQIENSLNWESQSSRYTFMDVLLNLDDQPDNRRMEVYYTDKSIGIIIRVDFILGEFVVIEIPYTDLEPFMLKG